MTVVGQRILAPEILAQDSARSKHERRRGMADKEIAAPLGIAERTVRFHLQSIFAKLCVTDRHAAARVLAEPEAWTKARGMGAPDAGYSGSVNLPYAPPLGTGETGSSSVSISDGKGSATVTLVTASGTQTSPSSNRSITISNSQLGSDTAALHVWYRVIATDEGHVGQVTACGHTIQPSDQFVAIPVAVPSYNLCGAKVIVENGSTEATVPVLETGPWCPNKPVAGGKNQCGCGSNFYWFGTGVPFAQTASCSTTHAGICLADGTFSAIGLTDNGYVLWRFEQ